MGLNVRTVEWGSMSGQYNGARAKLREFLGRITRYITCLGHKSNLCVEQEITND